MKFWRWLRDPVSPQFEDRLAVLVWFLCTEKGRKINYFFNFFFAVYLIQHNVKRHMKTFTMAMKILTTKIEESERAIQNPPTR